MDYGEFSGRAEKPEQGSYLDLLPTMTNNGIVVAFYNKKSWIRNETHDFVRCTMMKMIGMCCFSDHIPALTYVENDANV